MTRRIMHNCRRMAGGISFDTIKKNKSILLNEFLAFVSVSLEIQKHKI